ncbi:Bpu10I family restriction endonuclease [Geobacter sulfurreducens]|uniref:Bpu10I family restriction endonuclease n=1 Tax=Geobacter sulfurreducens TaxID=35554 RepID=UPI0005D91604|nr:Bpu10I family restriction endonuclease [Geobacter sulfurreducens]AJY68705.1 Bpu10I restriction endonuclease [Geobacter sulfurreducens]UTG91828.1 Bpu10I family restriction endonuclease [Geobacter sulfurreducens]
MPLPTPHLDKLNAAMQNDKMPAYEIPRLTAAITRYNNWIEQMERVDGDREHIVTELVRLFNEYKFYIDFDLIYCSEDDFLYRQKGQLKLDNTVIEEFLPHLVSKAFPELQTTFSFGPTKCFSAAYFQSSLQHQSHGGGLSIRTKDQDFAISRRLFIKSSHTANFELFNSVETCLGYVMAECKTNLDKTMFQEATATAHDVKSAAPGAKYFLICDWLDMTPVSTAPTDIDEVLILRKAKRISSNIRSSFSTYAGRNERRDWYREFLLNNPFSIEVLNRFIGHIESLINDEDPAEANVLEDGFF